MQSLARKNKKNKFYLVLCSFIRIFAAYFGLVIMKKNVIILTLGLAAARGGGGNSTKKCCKISLK